MKILRKLSLIFLVLLAVVIAAILVLPRQIAKKGLPDYSETLSFPGLKEEVTVYRDERGVPHIYAKNEADLYQVTGYVMAQERLWQMDLLRRITQGRVSEIFGADFIEVDLLLRALDYSKKSIQIMEEGDQDAVQALEAFTIGINYFIDSHEDELPVEFFVLGYKPDKWESYQSLNLIGYMAWDLKSGWNELIIEKLAARLPDSLLAEILPFDSNQQSVVFNSQTTSLLTHNKLRELAKLEDLGMDILSGSNNWAISGEKSETGKPLLANDMHLTLNVPGVWMQMHQVIEGELDVMGQALPGQPFVIVGHNDSIAWGMTNTYVDNLDFYEERIHPEDSNKYLYNAEWLDFEIVEEQILTKEGESVKKSFRKNHRGPVVSEFKEITDRVLTMKWVGDFESDELRSIYKLNRAENWDQFRDALTTFRTISQNIAYADVNGNIGLYCCAGVPIRKRDSVFAVLPGWTDEYNWQGLIPFDELPHEYNPESGYVASANNRTIGDDYPYHIGTWFAQPYRIDRIRNMLESEEKIGVEDFKRMQNDQVSEFAELFLESMLPVLNKEKLNEGLEQQMLTGLKSWDYDMNEKLVVPSVLESWTYFFLEEVMKDELKDELWEEYLKIYSLPRLALYNFLTHENSAWFDNVATPEKETIDEIAVSSFRSALKYLNETYGEDTINWKWGNLHQLTLAHPLSKVEVLNTAFKLNRGPYAVGGSYHTVSPYSYPWLKPGEVGHGSSHRNIYDLSDWNNSQAIIPTGISGIPGSEFYCNQTEDYIKGEYLTDWFDIGAIKTNSRYITTFKP